MNPFRSPTAAPDPIDESVLAVYTRRRAAIALVMAIWVFLAFWGYGAIRENAFSFPMILVLLVLTSGVSAFTWAALRRWPVLSIGADALTIHGPSPFAFTCVTVRRRDIEQAKWVFGDEWDELRLRLGETVHAAIYQSKVWSTTAPDERKVSWNIDREASLTHKRSEIREAVDAWLRATQSFGGADCLTDTRKA